MLGFGRASGSEEAHKRWFLCGSAKQYLRYQTGETRMTRPEKMLGSLREQLWENKKPDMVRLWRIYTWKENMSCEHNRSYLDSTIPNAWYLYASHHSPSSDYASNTCRSSPSVCINSQNGAFHLGPPSLLALFNFLACTSRLSTISAFGGDFTEPPSAGSVALRLTFCLLISPIAIF